MEILKTALQKIIDAEKNPDTLKEYKRKMKDVFE